MSGPVVTLALDTSAIVAYTQGSVHVGEVLAEVADEGNLAALPAACMVEATANGADRALLDVLAALPTTVVVADDIRPWQTLAVTYAAVGRYDATVAATVALHYDAGLLSRFPRLYAGVDNGSLLIPIED